MSTTKVAFHVVVVDDAHVNTIEQLGYHVCDAAAVVSLYRAADGEAASARVGLLGMENTAMETYAAWIVLATNLMHMSGAPEGMRKMAQSVVEADAQAKAVARRGGAGEGGLH